MKIKKIMILIIMILLFYFTINSALALVYNASMMPQTFVGSDASAGDANKMMGVTFEVGNENMMLSQAFFAIDMGGNIPPSDCWITNSTFDVINTGYVNISSISQGLGRCDFGNMTLTKNLNYSLLYNGSTGANPNTWYWGVDYTAGYPIVTDGGIFVGGCGRLNTGSGCESIADYAYGLIDMILYSTNQVPSIDIQNENMSYTNNPNYEIIYNVTDLDNDKIDCFLYNDTILYDYEFNVSYNINNSLITSFNTENQYDLEIRCGDGTINKSEYLSIVYDATNPIIIINYPSENNTYFNNNFTYNIDISDDNLYFSNITIYQNNDIKYSNSTIDYNVTSQNLQDYIIIDDYSEGIIYFNSLICDGHTGEFINIDYYKENNELIIGDTKIIFEDIDNLELIQKYDSISFNIETKSNYKIKLNKKEWNKVSNTIYKNHFININNKLWFDTNPFESLIIIEDNDYYIILMSIESKELNSIGSLNCIEENRDYYIDRNNPELTLLKPLNNDNHSISNSYNIDYYLNDSFGLSNCSLYINDNINMTSTSYTLGQNNTFITNLTTGEYNMSISCNDYANNINQSETIIFYLYQSSNTETEEIIDSQAKSIMNISKAIILLVMIIIWVILLIFSLIADSTFLLIIVTLIGITIGITNDFLDYYEVKIGFIGFNALLMLLIGIKLNDGAETK